MRKHQQKQILDVLKTIEQAQLAKLYGDCQEGALSLCDFIESIEGNESAGAEVVSLLVDYCELLFKANSGEVGEKTLRKHLIKIENGVTYNLKANRIEMAFISYKAAMADSLETIYLAAKADPNCDAYFIPIPYYEMLPNGQRGQLHYEGEEFYDSNKITITHYKDYNIEQRQPCAIFHFNPYDAGNLVTNVHPDYHFSKLKDSTDMLVYVPYFCLASIGYELTANLAGVFYSDKTILWFENMKKGLVDETKKQFQNMFDKNYLNNKFMVLGSPKIDKIINSKKEDYTISKEWSNLIQGKRVVLYNTTLGSLLSGNDEYLSLIEQTLQLFKENPNVILWWRPHPLMLSTLNSMRPNFLRRYLQIVNDYKIEGWGIYDDTHHLHRAITFSDAHFGDRLSSLYYMNIISGKPCMNAEISESNKVIFSMHSMDDFEKNIKTLQEFISYLLGDYAVSRERISKVRERYSAKGLDVSGMVGQKIYEHIKGCVSEQS